MKEMKGERETIKGREREREREEEEEKELKEIVANLCQFVLFLNDRKMES
jgi:hypothetical protein